MTFRDDGFTLIDALVALAFVSALTAATANLAVIAMGLTRDALEDSSASMLAVQKVEQLRSAVAAGVSPATAPTNALDEDVSGFFDRVDAGGRAVSGSSTSTTVFVRRWRVVALPSDSSPRRVLQVRVLVARHVRAAPAGDTSRARVPGETLLTTMTAAR